MTWSSCSIPSPAWGGRLHLDQSAIVIVCVADLVAGVRDTCEKVPVPVGVMDLISPGVRNAGKGSVAVIAVADRSVPVRYGGYGAVRIVGVAGFAIGGDNTNDPVK